MLRSLTHPSPRVTAKHSRAYLPNDVVHNGEVPAAGPDQAANLLGMDGHMRVATLKRMDVQSRADMLSQMPVMERVETMRLFYTGEKATLLDHMQRKLAVETLIGK